MLQHPRKQFDGPVCRDRKASSCYGIALAARIFEPDPVENLDRSPCILDESPVLQFAGNFAYRCPLRADHLRQKLLRQLEQSVPRAVLNHQQPASKPSGHVVEPVASRDLAEHEALILRISEKYSAQCLVAIKEPLQHAKFHPATGAADLHKTPGWNVQLPQ